MARTRYFSDTTFLYKLDFPYSDFFAYRKPVSGIPTDSLEHSNAA